MFCFDTIFDRDLFKMAFDLIPVLYFFIKSNNYFFWNMRSQKARLKLLIAVNYGLSGEELISFIQN